MKDVFRFTPQELRARRRVPDRLVADGGLELRVPYRPPLAWAAMLSFLAPRAIPGVETIDLERGVYRRTIELGGAPGVIEVWDEPERSALRLRVHLPAFDGLVHLLASVRRLFDLDADPTVIDTALARDRTLQRLPRTWRWREHSFGRIHARSKRVRRRGELPGGSEWQREHFLSLCGGNRREIDRKRGSTTSRHHSSCFNRD